MSRSQTRPSPQAGQPDASGSGRPEPDAPRDEERPGPLWQRILAGPVTWILLILLGLIAVFAAMHPDAFASEANLRNISVDASSLVVLAVGATFVIITAGIDLSVGSVLVFSAVVSAKLMAAVGGDTWGVIILGFVAALAAGVAWGALNGLLVTKAKVPPFIVTLGTLGMALGFAYIITDGLDERNVPPRLVDTIGTGDAFGRVPYLVLIAAAVAIIGAIVLAATRFGRYTYAVGSNAEAVRRAGINVDRHLIKVYAFAGLLAGLAGFLSVARFGSTTIAGHQTDVFQVIAAVVLGGTSLFGGIGWVAGTVVGVFIPVVLTNGFVISGVQPFWQQVAVGAILIVAVYLDQRRRAKYRT